MISPIDDDYSSLLLFIYSEKQRTVSMVRIASGKNELVFSLGLYCYTRSRFYETT